VFGWTLQFKIVRPKAKKTWK